MGSSLRSSVRWVIVLLGLPIIGLRGVPPASAELDGYGPFPVRNFQLIQVMFLGMQGDRATVLKPGALDIRIELAETANIFNQTLPNVTAQIKLEQLRSGLFFRYGLTERLEVAMEIPAYYRYEGFMNGMISQAERLTSGLSPPRAALKNTPFVYNLSRNGQTLFSGSDGQLALGDITLYGKYQLLKDQSWVPAISLRTAVKVPSGDSGRFFGTGHTDLGVGAAVEKRLFERWFLYGNLNGIFPTGSVATLSTHPIVSGLAAVEYLFTSNFSLTAQFDYYSSPFRDTGTKILDGAVTEVAFGFNYRLRPTLVWQVYGVENLDFTRDSAADFTLSTLMTYRFGR
jgi:hypothetical protein